MNAESHFKDWTAREEIAERLIPLVGSLYREFGVITTVYGKTLVHKDPTAIIKAHKYARKFDGASALNMSESEDVISTMIRLDLAPARVDIGKLISAYRNSNVALEEFLRGQLATIVDRKGSLLDAPRDVVLYGFGRIGRLLARMLVNKVGGGDKARLRAIVVRPKGEDLGRRASLLRRDSVHGPFAGSIGLDWENNALIVNGNFVKLIYANSPDEVDYTAHGINDAVVIDNTGKWRDEEGLGLHLKAKGASKVILTAPGKGSIPNIVFGVNHQEISEDVTILSAASCTTNAVVPPLKVIEDQFGIVSGHLETVHAYTNDQNLTDNYHPKARRNRSAAMNLVITSTGAASAAAKALPSLSGKLTGSAIRVPTPNVSLAVLNLQLSTETTREELNEHLRQVAMDGPLQDQIDWTSAPDVVSIDQVGNDH
ncbi:MAG TPA: glyceraldehyde-3-phosphate dehydrogenase, partial [Planctomycetaceae bacterium]|nr:glyceraldehyde-3-phosphate dehydrogenase [Planctomycetaceae bacterium]